MVRGIMKKLGYCAVSFSILFSSTGFGKIDPIQLSDIQKYYGIKGDEEQNLEKLFSGVAIDPKSLTGQAADAYTGSSDWEDENYFVMVRTEKIGGVEVVKIVGSDENFTNYSVHLFEKKNGARISECSGSRKIGCKF